uniref:Uncharacterized protein n=1 Tax=Romanomermis culicivorax TaxID=13658 RepID=A0A915L613_ROMCU
MEVAIFYGACAIDKILFVRIRRLDTIRHPHQQAVSYVSYDDLIALWLSAAEVEDRLLTTVTYVLKNICSFLTKKVKTPLT